MTNRLGQVPSDVLRTKSMEGDPYRDGWMRYLGYCNELGESFRPLINVKMVHLSYAVSIGYVIADTAHKSNKTLECSKNPLHTSITAMDTLLWQSLASVLLPGITINQVVKLTKGLVFQSFQSNVIRASVPTAVGLCTIPLIIHPIDELVDLGMNSWIRPHYPMQLPDICPAPDSS